MYKSTEDNGEEERCAQYWPLAHTCPSTRLSAVGDFLQALHVYKMTGDAEAGTRLFGDQMTSVDPDFWGTRVRGVVLKNKQPRPAYVQATTVLDEATGKVTLTHYEASPEGLVQSWADRAHVL